MDTKITVAEAIVKCLEMEKIEYAFGISGSHYLAFFHALKKSSIKFISVKHESAAGYMALHYSRIAQKPALLLATAGPGATNLITGIAELFKANLPCFVLTPIVPTTLQGKNAFQEDSGLGNSYSIVDLMKCVTKKSITCIHHENIQIYIQDLFRNSLSGRKGPVHLLIPTNFFEKKIKFIPCLPTNYRVVGDRSFDPYSVKAIAKAINSSKKPLLIVGHRSWYPNSSDSIAKLSNDFGIPVVLSASAKGLYDEYAPFFGGIFDLYGHRSAEVLIKKSDCIVSIGEDFGEFATNKFEENLFKDKLFQIDIDGYDIGRNYPANLGVCGHIGTIIDSIANELNNSGCKQFFGHCFSNEISQENDITTEDTSNTSLPLKPPFVLSELSNILPQNSIIIGDIGANGYFSLRNLKSRLLGFSVSMQNYTLGQGVAGAIGAKIAAPEKTVISLCGDGAFLMNGMEIATATQYNIPIIWMIFVNNNYGAVDWAQKLLYNDLEYCTSIKIPNLQKFADSFSMDFYKVTYANSLKSIISKAISNYISNQKSAILEIIIDSEEMLPLKPHSVKFIKDICNIEEYNPSPYLMKAFKRMLREKV